MKLKYWIQKLFLSILLFYPCTPLSLTNFIATKIFTLVKSRVHTSPDVTHTFTVGNFHCNWNSSVISRPAVLWGSLYLRVTSFLLCFSFSVLRLSVPSILLWGSNNRMNSLRRECGRHESIEKTVSSAIIIFFPVTDKRINAWKSLIILRYPLHLRPKADDEKDVCLENIPYRFILFYQTAVFSSLNETLNTISYYYLYQRWLLLRLEETDGKTDTDWNSYWLRRQDNDITCVVHLDPSKENGSRDTRDDNEGTEIALQEAGIKLQGNFIPGLSSSEATVSVKDKIMQG